MQLTNPYNYIDYWRYRGRIVADKLAKSLNEAIKKNDPAVLQDSNFPELTQQIIDWREQVAGNLAKGEIEAKFSPSDSAGFYAAKMNINQYSDEPHLVERQQIATVDSKGAALGVKIYYRSPAFWEASACVNRPVEIPNTYSEKINGFESRCSAYGVAIAVLTECGLPDSHGNFSVNYPEGYTPRRNDEK